MDDRRALMAAIVTAPGDDTPRLVLADWLEEHGEADRAKFIRLQCWATRPPGYRADMYKPAGEEAKLIRRFAARWLGPLDPKNCRSVYHGGMVFDRGLLYQWHGSAGTFVKRKVQEAVTAWFPVVGVNALTLSGVTKRPEAVFASEALAWVPRLEWRDAKAGDTAFAVLAASPHVRNLSAFEMWSPRCTDAGLTALAKSRNLPRLRSFALVETLWADFTAKGLLRVLNSDRLPLLESFELSGFGPVGFRPAVFLRDPGIARLKRLILRGGLTPPGPRDDPIRALANSPHAVNLEHLDLSETELTDAAAGALADSPHLGNLRELVLRDMNDFSRRRLSPAAERRLRDRFGRRLTLEHSILVGDDEG